MDCSYLMLALLVDHVTPSHHLSPVTPLSHHLSHQVTCHVICQITGHIIGQVMCHITCHSCHVIYQVTCHLSCLVNCHAICHLSGVTAPHRKGCGRKAARGSNSARSGATHTCVVRVTASPRPSQPGKPTADALQFGPDSAR